MSHGRIRNETQDFDGSGGDGEGFLVDFFGSFVLFNQISVPVRREKIHNVRWVAAPAPAQHKAASTNSSVFVLRQ